VHGVDHRDAELLNVSLAEQKSMQNASAHAIQRVIEGLVSDGKYLWHAFQNGNDIGDNTNNNSGHVGGTAHDAAYCTAWMAQRCDTAWVKERAITVQFDKVIILCFCCCCCCCCCCFAWMLLMVCAKSLCLNVVQCQREYCVVPRCAPSVCMDRLRRWPGEKRKLLSFLLSSNE
jgi:hypothetical protein